MAYVYSYPYYPEAGLNGAQYFPQTDLSYYYGTDPNAQNIGSLFPGTQFSVPGSDFYGQQNPQPFNFGNPYQNNNPSGSSEETKKFISAFAYLLSSMLYNKKDTLGSDARPEDQTNNDFTTFFKTSPNEQQLLDFLRSQGLNHLNKDQETSPGTVESSNTPVESGNTWKTIITNLFSSMNKNPETAQNNDQNPFKKQAVMGEGNKGSQTLPQENLGPKNNSNESLSSQGFQDLFGSISNTLKSILHLPDGPQNTTQVPPKSDSSTSTEASTITTGAEIKLKADDGANSKLSEIKDDKQNGPEKISDATNLTNQSSESGGGLSDLFSSVKDFITHGFSFLPHKIEDLIPHTTEQDDKATPEVTTPIPQESSTVSINKSTIGPGMGRMAKTVPSQPKNDIVKKKGRVAVKIERINKAARNNKIVTSKPTAARTRLIMKHPQNIGRVPLKPIFNLTEPPTLPPPPPPPTTTIPSNFEYYPKGTPEINPRQPEFYDSNPDPNFPYDNPDTVVPAYSHDYGAALQIKPSRHQGKPQMRHQGGKRRCDSRYERCEGKRVVRVERVKTQTSYKTGSQKRYNKVVHSSLQRPAYYDYPGYMSRSSKSLSGSDDTLEDEDTTEKPQSNVSVVTPGLSNFSIVVP